jgi:hypothetical protein
VNGPDHPEGYATLQDAVHAVAWIKYAGLDAHAAVIKTREAGYDVRFTVEDMEESAKKLWELIDATHEGRNRSPPIYIWAEQPKTGRLMRIEPSKLAGVPFARAYKGLSLIYLRPTHPYFREFSACFSAPLDDVVLMLRTEDLASLARNFRRTMRRRPSRPTLAKPIGRPSSQGAIRIAILAITAQGKWHARHDSLGMLIQILGRLPYKIETSESTVRRSLKV